MSRFNTQIGANDTSGFSQSAAINQQGRNATQDRQLRSRELQAQIVQNTNQNRLQSNQQGIEVFGLQLENEQALRALSGQFLDLQNRLLQGRQQDQTIRRGQELEATAQQNALDVQQSESALDRAARADLQTQAGDTQQALQTQRLGVQESEGGLDRGLQERVTDLGEEGRDRRQTERLAAESEATTKQLKTQLAIAQQGDEAALQRLDTELAARREADFSKYINDKSLVGIQHKNDLERLKFQLENDPETAGVTSQMAINAANGQDANGNRANFEDISNAIAILNQTDPNQAAALQNGQDLRFLQEFEKQIGDAVFNGVTLKELERMQEKVKYVSPEIQQLFVETIVNNPSRNTSFRRGRKFAQDIRHPSAFLNSFFRAIDDEAAQKFVQTARNLIR